MRGAKQTVPEVTIINPPDFEGHIALVIDEVLETWRSDELEVFVLSTQHNWQHVWLASQKVGQPFVTQWESGNANLYQRCHLE